MHWAFAKIQLEEREAEEHLKATAPCLSVLSCCLSEEVESPGAYSRGFPCRSWDRT